MDITLQGMRETKALAILKADLVTAHIPVIALAAIGMPGGANDTVPTKQL